jgi:hypothetical protein
MERFSPSISDGLRTQKITSAKRPVDLTVRNDLTKKQTTTP